MAFDGATDTVGPCPSDEEIAAFLDGMLAAEERARLTAHLAGCQPCYEVFAGAVCFAAETAGSGDGARVVPFPFAKREAGKKKKDEPSRGRPTVPGWLLPAAAAVLAIGIGFGGYRAYFAPVSPASMVVTELTAPLASRSDAAHHLYPFIRYRGAGDRQDQLIMDERPSFMVGVLLVDLRLAPQAEDPQATAEGILGRIGSAIESAGSMDDLAGRYRRDALQAKGSAAFVRRIEAEIPRREAELDGSFLDHDALAFGKWAEASRLAAITQSSDLFTNRNNRRFLSQILAQKQKELAERRTPARPEEEDLRAEREAVVVKILRRIVAAWEPGAPPKSYPALAKDCGELISRYDL